MNKIYFILFAISSIHIYAQNGREIITGKIISDSIVLSNVNIVNKTMNKGTASNQNGVFKILVKKNDVLQFSNIQYETKKITFNKNQVKNGILIISLKEKTNELQEVVIQNMAKYLDLPNADKKPLNKLERNLNAYSQAPTPIVIIATLFGQQGGIDDIYNIISGNRKRDRKLKSLLETDKLSEINYAVILQIRDHFQDDFFIETIRIPRENILDFIQFCEPKGIIYLFNTKRYMEVIDIFVKNKTAYLNTLNKIDE